MLKPTQNTLTKEQFSKLREAKRVIKRQFGVEFSLQSERLVRDVYEFALRSETNELFQIFSELNALSAEPLEQPLNEEQFILLRLANSLIREEFAEELALAEAGVLDLLYGFALNSAEEDLFDIYMYLYSRPDRPPQGSVPVATGERFRKIRDAKHLAETEHKQIAPLRPNKIVDTLTTLATETNDPQLLETVSWLNAELEDAPGITGFIFTELSAPDFERLREAKLGIYEEFGEAFSLHADTALDDLYGFALRSRDIELFDLFCDLLGPQMASRPDTLASRAWLSKEQFMLLRAAREAILAEFGVMLVLQSGTLQDDLYQFALRAEEEELFDVCSAFQQLFEPTTDEATLPSKEEFRMLRHARYLVDKEFSEELNLNSDVIESDLYKYAVSSEADDLFDLFMDLMALRSNGLPESPADLSRLLSKEEFVELRGAKRLILTEFGEHLALQEPNVLDRLYAFALESDSDALFDLHAKLNANAAQVESSPETSAAAAEATTHKTEEALPEAKPQAMRRANKLLSWWHRFPGNRQGETDLHPPATAKQQAATDTSQTESNTQVDTDTPAEPAVLQSSFPDLLVKAMADKNTAVRVHEVDLQESTDRKNNKAAKGSAAVKSTRERRPPAAATAASEKAPTETESSDRGWYVSTIDDRLRVSLGSKLSVGVAGELMVAAPQGTQSLAVIEMVANKPVVFAQDNDLLVNDQPVRDKHALAAGDRIAVAGSLLQVEYADQN